MLRRVRWLTLALVLAACHTDGATPPPEVTYQLVPVGGSAVAGPAGSRLLAVPLVTVTDPSGTPVSGVKVMLTVAAGAPAGLTLPEQAAASGPDGVVRADVQLGAVGQAQIRVRREGTEPVEALIPVTALEAPVLSSVAPTTFGPGDVVQLAGSGLTSAAGGLAVYVGGVRATILASSPTEIRIRAPACVSPGEVSVVVNVTDMVASNVVPAVYAASEVAPSLQPFEGVTVPAARAAQCLSLLGGGARYLVVPQYATSDAVPSTFLTLTPGFTIGAPSATATAARRAASAAGAAALRPQERLDRALRLRERDLAPIGAASGAHPPLEAPPLAALTLNSARSFRVLADLDGSRYTGVTGRLRYIGDNVLIYVDETAPADGLSAEDIEGLGGLFDAKLFPADVEAFGSVTDIDRNDRVVVLMTPVVNKLTTASECDASGFVTGFFFGLDLLPSQQNSNKGEVFYAMVPDPRGSTGSCAHPVDEVLKYVPATFIHEMQHMISYGQHVLVRGGRDEELWLNEGLSHIAEELGSLLYERECENVLTPPCRSTTEQLFPDSSQGFIIGNITDAYDYLARSTSTSMTLFTGDGTLEERGAAWLFLRWLGDQKGDGIFRRLVETRLTGVANVEDKAGEPFARLFGDFGVAVYAVDRLSTTPPGAVPARYRFLSRDLRQIFRRLYDTNTEGVTRPFPIEATVLHRDDALRGSMRPGTMTWYELRTASGDGRVRVSLTPSTGSDFDPRLGAQVTIFRLP
ncbi:MAG TPA: IPT/TIG domain-containing protein [Gemmatimonadaceae bacterium]|nr:IPT/TIG domain-containing protein [Gemmatimonadaceae bacterium]